MNLTIIRALLEDSRQQVLDNKVFRFLILLTGIPILTTFIVGFHADHIDVLWGLYEVEYSSIISAFGGGGASGADTDYGTMFIHGFQNLIVQFFAGSIGVMFCIAATAFFMPRVLEKGAADTLFSKPVSRFAILISRYLAGLLFISGIALVLVTGMFLGFGVSSGYWDSGFLWSAATLVYLFGMMHAFSLCVAALTRSSTAAILMTIVLFFITGRIHWGWELMHYIEHTQAAEMLRATKQAGVDDETMESQEEEQSRLLTVFLDSVSTLHYVLPKTRDADIISNKLRRALTEPSPALTSSDEELVIKQGPEGFVLDPASTSQLDAEGVRWQAAPPKSPADGWVTVRRYPRPEVERGLGKKKRMAPQRGLDAARSLEKELEDAGVSLDTIETSREFQGGLRMHSVHWEDSLAEQTVSHQRVLFDFGDWIYAIDFVESPNLHDNEHRGKRVRAKFLDPLNMTLGDAQALNQPQWYAREFGWTSPWRFNIFFSIGSSLAFIVAMLGLAWLRLRRIDF